MLKNKIKNKYKIKNKFYNYFIKNESNNNIILIKLNLDHPFEEFFDDFINKNKFEYNKKNMKKCKKVFYKIKESYNMLNIIKDKEKDKYILKYDLY